MDDNVISISALQDVYNDVDQTHRTRFNRSIPFHDGFVDRWERAKSLGFGEGSSLFGSTSILGTPEVGENVWIGPNVYIEAINAPIAIGDWSILSANVQIYTHHTVARALTFGSGSNHVAPVQIGKGCYIGPNAVIEAGSTLGNQCVVGAMSLVRGTFPDCAFVAGIPAKHLGTVVVHDDNTYSVEPLR